MKTVTIVSVASTSNPNRSYRVWVDETGPVFCECPGHKYARGGVRKPCRHMEALARRTAVADAASYMAKTTAAVSKLAGSMKKTAGALRAMASMLPPEETRFQFLEVQQQVGDEWQTVVDLRRISNLEVQTVVDLRRISNLEVE